MNIQEAYNNWSKSYDEVQNKTRDLEGIALRETLGKISFENALEIGCGTGKNTKWLVENTQKLTSVDLSEEMLAKAKGKISSEKVNFILADINGNWDFVQNNSYDLIGFSLVLEHIEKLDEVFSKAVNCLKSGGYLYIGELHPFKQYNGTKARFETENGTQIVDCFNHNISDFVQIGMANGLIIKQIDEYFDEKDKATVPRILAILFQKERI